MAFAPKVLHPEPDAFFVRELRKIDPDLRVVFGYERYLQSKWVIERRIEPTRYFQMYASLLESGEPRFIEQPIYDTDQPIYGEWEIDQDGQPYQPLLGYEQVGTRKYDLAPEYEWVMTIENDDQTFRPLDARTLLKLRRTYAWDRFHSFTRLKMEKDREREENARKMKEQHTDELLQEFKDHRREIYKLPFVGQPSQVFAEKES